MSSMSAPEYVYVYDACKQVHAHIQPADVPYYESEVI